MNLPNKLTLARCVLVPVFLAALLMQFPYHFAVALLIFIVASLTDLLDGKIARKRGLVTNLGKFLDPLADKALTTTAFLGIMCYRTIGWWETRSLCWALTLILAREFAVTSARLLAARDGKVVAASMAGKIKTVLEMISIMYMLALMQAVGMFGHQWGKSVFTVLVLIGHGLIWISVVAAIVSGIQYVWNCRHYFAEK